MNKNQRNCPDCGTNPGKTHKPGCDVERCPRCGGQNISCDCIYIECNMNPSTLETEFPEIYSGGPTEPMTKFFEELWGSKRIPWSGKWPGEEECETRGLWQINNKPVPSGTPGASHDLNRLYRVTQWDPIGQKRILRRKIDLHRVSIEANHG